MGTDHSESVGSSYCQVTKYIVHGMFCMHLHKHSIHLMAEMFGMQFQDRTPPVIYWNFGSRCYGRMDAGRCAASVWSLELSTFDADSGILRVQSNPKGLLVRSKYTAATKDEIKATYSASCCAPRVTITSYDVAGNQRSITIDVNDFYLGTAEIVAIILGVILLIVIIAIIVAGIVCYCKRKKESRDLPVYRGRADRD